MIKAVFYKKNGLFDGFDVSGHAGYAKSGRDVVCAAVSSAVMLSANLLTDSFGEKAKVSAQGDTISLKCNSEVCDKVLSALYEHLGYISQEYKGTVSIIIKEDKNHA